MVLFGKKKKEQEQVADEEALRALRAASPELQRYWEGEDPSEWHGVEWGGGRVRELDLCGRSWKELPAQIGRLTGLTTLILEKCKQLTALPAELGLLTGLAKLYLNGCEQLTALPAELGLLTGLTTLNLVGCEQLTALPAELGLLTGLTELYLGGCEQLTALPTELGQTGLTSLDLRGCNQLTALPAELGQLVNLTLLSLEGCKQLTALPAELGLLTGLTSLDLRHCKQLTALPAELGRLTGLTKLDLRGCNQLTALPAELGQLLNLTSLHLRGCDQLTLPPGAPADAKKTTFAPPTIVAYAPLLIVQPRKDTPGQLHAFLLATPLAVPPFFKTILTDAAHAEWLGKAVAATPDLARLTDRDGRRAIDVAHSECKQQMQAALYLLSCYDVDDGPLLHRSATSAVAAADDHTDPKVKPVPRVALKAMRRPEQVLAELQGRIGLDSKHVVAVRAVFADKEAVDHDKAAWALIESAATELGIEAQQFKAGLSTYVYEHLIKNQETARPAAAVLPGNKPAPLERKPTQRTLDASSKYSFLLVLDLADRSLATALLHDRIAANEWPLVRKIGGDLARALDHLHVNERIHADGKPHNIVRVPQVDTNFTTFFDWQLIDMDVSCRFEEGFGSKLPSTGYAPPEAAKVFLEATDPSTGLLVNEKALGMYKASVAYDLWSFGLVLFHLGTGKSLWHTNQDDSISRADLRKLAGWDEQKRKVALRRFNCENPTKDEVALRDLVLKLLAPSQEERLKNFSSTEGLTEMMQVLQHPFLDSRSLADATIETLSADIKAVNKQLGTVIEMSEKHRREMQRTCEVLITSIYEATEVLTPTTFIILEEQLPPEIGEADKQKLLALAEDGRGIELTGDLKQQVENAKTWISRLKTFTDGLIERDSNKVIGGAKDFFSDLLTKEVVYLYLIDELSGEPVRGAGYPIEITTPSDLVPKLLPLMQVGMRAMSVYNGVAGVAQMFGYPVPKVPETLRKGAQSSVEILKQESSVEAFGAVHAAVQKGGEQQETTRGASLRDLQRLFEEKDKEKGYAGLRRVGGEDGTALWTLLKEEEVTAKLEKRAKERRQEESQHDAFVRARLDTPAAATAAGLGLTEAAPASVEARHQAELKSEREKTAHLQAKLESELEERVHETARLQAELESERAKAQAEHMAEDKSAGGCCVIG